MNGEPTDVTRQIVAVLTAVGEGRISLDRFVQTLNEWQADQSARGKNAMVSSNHVSPEHQRALRGRGGWLAVLSLAIRLEELNRLAVPGNRDGIN